MNGHALDFLSLSLVVGAWIGVVVRAYFVNGQSIFTRETGLDAFVGSVLAVAWVFPLPGVSTIYPPFAFPKEWPFWVPGVMFSMFSALFVSMAKTALLKWAPTYFAKWTGQDAPKEPPKP